SNCFTNVTSLSSSRNGSSSRRRPTPWHDSLSVLKACNEFVEAPPILLSLLLQSTWSSGQLNVTFGSCPSHPHHAPTLDRRSRGALHRRTGLRDLHGPGRHNHRDRLLPRRPFCRPAGLKPPIPRPVSPPTTHLGNVNASNFATTCIATTQTATTSTTSEDCLFGNIYLLINTTPTSALPVLIYFYGGGFEGGEAREFTYLLIFTVGYG
ncbi:hypothetical protein B0H16DRAFT_1699562, partial [Mycena metata]